MVEYGVLERVATSRKFDNLQRQILEGSTFEVMAQASCSLGPGKLRKASPTNLARSGELDEISGRLSLSNTYSRYFRGNLIGICSQALTPGKAKGEPAVSYSNPIY
jgi:hypothetical protein